MSARNAGDTFNLRCQVREKLIEYIRTEYPESLPGFRITGVVNDEIIKN